jgi:hypothetical protein
VFCNFYLVKNYKTANNLKIPETRKNKHLFGNVAILQVRSETKTLGVLGTIDIPLAQLFVEKRYLN